MEYSKFKSIIELMITHNKKSHIAYNVLAINLYDTFEEQSKAIDLLWHAILTIEGEEWLSWYLYEKDGVSGNPRKDFKAWDGKKEICKDIKGLYDYLTKQKYFRNYEKN